MTDTNPNREVATVAGGCFWCLQPIFQDLRGVEKVEVGYSGGHLANPSYEAVCTDTTGHAEAVQVTFDPQTIPLVDILRIFFSLRDLHALHGTREGGEAGHPGDRGSRDLAETHRDGGGSAHRVLPRGGVPPRLLPQESYRGLLSRRRRAEGREVPQAVLGSTEEGVDRRLSTGTPGLSFSSQIATFDPMKSGHPRPKC